jgi:hypothetical protein
MLAAPPEGEEAESCEDFRLPLVLQRERYFCERTLPLTTVSRGGAFPQTTAAHAAVEPLILAKWLSAVRPSALYRWLQEVLISAGGALSGLVSCCQLTV